MQTYNLSKKGALYVAGAGLVSLGVVLYYVLIFTAASPCEKIKTCEHPYIMALFVVFPLCIGALLCAYVAFVFWKKWRASTYETVNVDPAPPDEEWQDVDEIEIEYDENEYE